MPAREQKALQCPSLLMSSSLYQSQLPLAPPWLGGVEAPGKLPLRLGWTLRLGWLVGSGVTSFRVFLSDLTACTPGQE